MASAVWSVPPGVTDIYIEGLGSGGRGGVDFGGDGGGGGGAGAYNRNATPIPVPDAAYDIEWGDGVGAGVDSTVKKIAGAITQFRATHGLDGASGGTPGSAGVCKPNEGFELGGGWPRVGQTGSPTNAGGGGGSSASRTNPGNSTTSSPAFSQTGFPSVGIDWNGGGGDGGAGGSPGLNAPGPGGGGGGGGRNTGGGAPLGGLGGSGWIIIYDGTGGIPFSINNPRIGSFGNVPPPPAPTGKARKTGFIM